MVKPTVISTFAGCGGSSLGYQMAGFHELLAVEWDQNAVDTFRLNFPDVPVYHGDIAKLTGAECMRLAGIKKGILDVLDGSPPCQGFSTAGKRKFDDPRNSLFKEYARLLNELQPKVFVMENVTGMVKGCMKQAYLTIIKTLRDCGYKAKGEVMNAMYFNVPQSRERVIIIGVREDLGIEPSHPKPQGRPITVRNALVGILHKDGLIPRGALKNIVPLVKQGEGANKHHPKGNYFGTHRLAWDKPSPTLIKTAGATMNCLLHPEIDEGISINEAKRLQSFPDSFSFNLDYETAWARIGNSVPPNLMKAIAEHIKINILSNTK
jgi:DNA (cytosine-5)-methyltransferase 1